MQVLLNLTNIKGTSGARKERHRESQAKETGCKAGSRQGPAGAVWRPTALGGRFQEISRE